MTQARSFGAAADRYDRYRPGYAADAAAWALGDQPLRVVDVGAGTGILSRLLRRLGHDVIAVEPDDAMLARLRAVSPDLPALAGTAESLPLTDGSVDAVVAGQAYHWFEGDRAHAEIARVLRPGGVFAALWNDADPGASWTVRLTEIIDGAVRTRRSDFGERFHPVRVREFRHEEWTTPDDLVAMTTTRSPYLVADPQTRRDLLDAVRRLVEEAGLRGRFPMPHLTRVHKAAPRRP